MAIKEQHLAGNRAVPDNCLSIKMILETLESIEGTLIEKNLMGVCESTIRDLVHVYVPTTLTDLKVYRMDLEMVGAILHRIVKMANEYEMIFAFCIQTLYKEIVMIDKPSTAAGIVLNIYDETLLPDAIKALLTNSTGIDMDDEIKKVIITLCTWLRTFSDYNNLNKCIIEMLDGLQEMKKYILLMEISNQLIEQLFISLIIPCIRPNVFPVVVHILKSAQSHELFHKILGRIPKVFHQIENSLGTATNDISVRDLQLLVDIVSALMVKFPVNNNIYNEIETAFRKFKPSDNFQTQLDVKPWYPLSTLSTRDPKIPIGLINMGNTCYMNSVLQALCMTKEFSYNILMVNYSTRITKSIQQLISLLLYSIRPELVPHDVLMNRPPNFRNGHQQDSFEYLGFLLDHLHEEDKNHLTNERNLSELLNGHIKKHPHIVDDNRSKEMDMDCDETALQNGNGNGNSLLLINTDVTESNPIITSENNKQRENNETSVSKTLIQKSFGGKMSVTYKCLNCSFKSTIVDNFFDLQLSFPHTNDNNVPLSATNYSTQTLLDAYFSTEKLINDDKYYCEQCNMLCDGERDINLENGPTNLILVIKRFKYDRKIHVRRKILHKVHHNETVILTTHNENNDHYRLTYKVYATIVHSGMNIDSGHYYTFAKDPSNNWFKFNDSHICHSSLDEIKNLNDLNTPYMLFFELVKREKIDSRVVDELPIIIEWPEFGDLPPSLRDYIVKDNFAYAREFQRRNFHNNYEV